MKVTIPEGLRASVKPGLKVLAEDTKFESVESLDFGVTEAEVEEYEPLPAALTAATWNTYAVPLVNPVTVNEVLALAV